jgi:hypothetical protein
MSKHDTAPRLLNGNQGPQAQRSRTCSQNWPKLTSIPPVAQPRNMSTGFAPVAYHELNQLDPDQQNPTNPNPQIPLIVWKVHAAHNREHAYHDTLQSAEVAQLYPQVGDFITS